MCAHKLCTGYSYKLCKCLLHHTHQNKQVIYYDCLWEGLRSHLYAQRQCNQLTRANSHCGTISIPPSPLLPFCMQTYIQNTMAIIKRITMMRATTAPTAIPIMWFVLRPTDGGDGKKDAMGEDVVRQGVGKGVSVTIGRKKKLVANRNDNSERFNERLPVQLTSTLLGWMN